MTQREKIGLASIIAVFVLLVVALVITYKPFGSKQGSFEDSAIIQHRVNKERAQ